MCCRRLLLSLTISFVLLLRFRCVAVTHLFDLKGAVNFASVKSQIEGGYPVDYNTITNLFLQNLIREATTFLLDVLKPNLPEHGFLQTKVLEINLVTFPNVAGAILPNGMFTHYEDGSHGRLEVFKSVASAFRSSLLTMCNTRS